MQSCVRKKEFPQTPDYIRQMIEDRVEEQLHAQKLYSWTDYAVGDKEEVAGEDVFANKAASSQMENLHGLGESFQVPSFCYSAAGEYISSENVEVKVTSVEVSDDLALLENEYIPEEWKTAVGSDGRLVKNELTYFKRGDGVHTLDEAVKAETMEQRNGIIAQVAVWPELGKWITMMLNQRKIKTIFHHWNQAKAVRFIWHGL